jgi:hypothetical protein
VGVRGEDCVFFSFLAFREDFAFFSEYSVKVASCSLEYALAIDSGLSDAPELS